MRERPSIPKIIDSNIFNVDTNKERDIKIIDIDIKDNFYSYSVLSNKYVQNQL